MPATAKTKINFSVVSFEDATPDDIKHSRASKYEQSPLRARLESRKPTLVRNITADEVDAYRRELNGAAKAANLGVTITPHPLDNGSFDLAFQGKDRTKVTRQPLTEDQRKQRAAKRAATKKANAAKKTSH